MSVAFDAAGSSTEGRLLLFSLRQEWYAVELGRVAGIELVGQITPVPGAPETVLGVQDMRGQLLAVIDSARLLGLPPLEHGRHVVVLAQPDAGIGLLVGRAEDIVSCDLTTGLEPVSEGNDWVKARLQYGEHLVGLIDVPAVVRKLTSS